MKYPNLKSNSRSPQFLDLPPTLEVAELCCCLLRPLCPGWPGLFQSVNQDSVDSEAACDKHLGVHQSKVATNSTQQHTTAHNSQATRFRGKTSGKKAAADFFYDILRKRTQRKECGGTRERLLVSCDLTTASVVMATMNQIWTSSPTL